MKKYEQRLQLLNDTRKQYRQARLPAVHPRYHSTYSYLYETGNEKPLSAAYTRLIICFILFILFAVCDLKELEYHHLNTSVIVQQIQTPSF